VVFSDGTAQLDLYKGQSAHYDLLAGRFSRSLENPDDVSAWTESRFVYDNINLVELADKLSRTYAVQFHFNTPDYLDYKFNISLRNNETLSDVLSALERIIPVKTRIEGDNVYVDKK
jgi:ferric-dicitrate binding protein FerR (iron transport regulator)